MTYGGLHHEKTSTFFGYWCCNCYKCNIEKILQLFFIWDVMNPKSRIAFALLCQCITVGYFGVKAISSAS